MSTKVNVYLSFDGTCEEAFTFYATVFKCKIAYSCKYAENAEMSANLSDSDKNKILHCYLPISKETALMGSDTVKAFCSGSADLIKGNNMSMSISTETEEEAKRIFAELSAGGEVTMPLEKTFWDALYGMFTDKFGTLWMVNYSYEKQ